MKVKRYKVEFDFNLDDRFFEGREEIILGLEKKSNLIKIDCEDLEIRKINVNDKEAKWSLNDGKLKIYHSFKSGVNKIQIIFSGVLKEGLAGIYLSKYLDDRGVSNYLITTQMEPVDARKAFPCFDHPGFKARFDLTIKIPKDLKAIFNTLPFGEKIEKDKKIIRFKTTPLMSTYLFYLGIGKWHFLKKKDKNILFRIATANKDKLRGGKFALDHAIKFLRYLENYFDYPYPLEKLDLIAIPDFAAGAMENWGAVAFRENLLLAFPDITPLSSRERILEVIAHELVHMWFGNLATMKWWDDLWLNESFATYFGYKVVDHFYPHWRLKERYVLDETISALNADGLINSHPIKVKVKKAEESNEIFDEISYEKGGSILRMIENYLGENKFKEALRDFIKKYAYQNANYYNFLSIFSKYGTKQILKICDQFIRQANFPLVRVKRKNKFYLINQEKFTFLPSKNKNRWKIPLILEDNKRFIVNGGKTKIKDDFLLVNKNFSGFYLLGHEEDEIRCLLQKREKLNDLDIISIITSYDFLTRKGEKKFDNLFSLIENFQNEKSELILDEVISILKFYYLLVPTKKLKLLIEKYGFRILDLLGNEPSKNEAPHAMALRSKALIYLGMIKNKEILKYCKEKFRKFLAGSLDINPDIKQAIFNNAIIAESNNFYKLLEYFNKISLIEEQNRCLLALGQTTQSQKAKYLLNLILTDKVRLSQSVFIFSSLSSNKKFAHLLFKWLSSNWSNLEVKGGGAGKSDFLLMRILKICLPYVGTFIDSKELNDFLRKDSVRKFTKTIEVIKEKIKINKRIILNFYGRNNYF
ncbi:MAG: M1 family metallopeptidase [Patescibacteria group bacterium]|nr:M1 family metallopeptidase [Patescibacteria group bacterium]